MEWLLLCEPLIRALNAPGARYVVAGALAPPFRGGLYRTGEGRTHRTARLGPGQGGTALRP